jgi:formylglycine-generating enzyme required for sulfatase activity
MSQVFISYSRKDLAFIEQLATDLKVAHFDVWYDLSRLEGGMPWRTKIEKAINDSQYVLVILSPDSVTSKWVEEEFLLASELGKNIIPLYYKPCALPLGYRRLQIIDVYGSKYLENYQEILRALNINRADREAAEKAVLARVEREAAEKAAREKEEREAEEKAKLKEREQEAAKKAKREKAKQRAARILRFIGTLGIAVILFWGGSKIMPLFNEIVPTAKASATFSATTSFLDIIVPLTSTKTPKPPATKTIKAVVSSTPRIGSGSIQISNVDEMHMLRVPAGTFDMGNYSSYGREQCEEYSTKLPPSYCMQEWFYNEEPPHSISLASYWIDQTEVTNRMYSLCVDADACQPPKMSKSATRASYFDNPTYENYPVIYVSWDDAKTYCEWAGRRLPTEAEWERAARGSTSTYIYPWGNNPPTADLMNFNNTVGDTTTVGSYPKGASPVGASDMAGNVWEWVYDWYDEYYYNSSPSRNPKGPSTGSYRVLRGGSWNNNDGMIPKVVNHNKARGYIKLQNLKDQITTEFPGNEIFARTTYRFWSSPSAKYNFVGFRCASDATP